MHLGRFHRAIELLHMYYKTSNPAQLIQELTTCINNVAANPGNPDIANAYKASLDKCRYTLALSPLNAPRPILKNMLESINADKFIGDALFLKIRDAISANPAAPSLVTQALSTIQQETQEFFQHIANLDNSFSKLRVEYYELDDGEAEIGLLVPRDPRASTLKDLSKEFNQWHIALSPIAEVFDPTADPLQIKTCATTDWAVYLTATPVILFGISKCVKGVNVILRELIESKNLIEQLIAKKRSPSAIEALEKEQAEMVNKELRALAEKIVDEHCKDDDPGRKNELKNALTQSLHTITEKIATGTQLEVRMLPPVIKENPGEGAHQDEMSNNKLLELGNLAKEFDDEIDALSFNGEMENIKALLVKPGEITPLE